MSTGTLRRDLAELALEARSRDEFRRLSLERICRATAMDAGAVNHAAALSITVESHGFGVDRLRAALIDYMNEITPSEFARALRGQAICDADVFSARRRAALHLYSDYLIPGGLFGFCARMWINGHGCFWITLSREGRRARYGQRDLQALDDVVPLMMVGEALHARPPTRLLEPGDRQAWGAGRHLTAAESRTVELMGRGLSNREIATVLGRSVHTVRNQLASVFQKLRVSTRTELLFLLSQEDPRGAGEVPSRLRTLARAVQLQRPPGCSSTVDPRGRRRSD